jgi:hypothetical protein
MDFKVYTPDGVHSYQDGASYALGGEGAGTLQVRTAGGNVILYGPTGWRWLEEVTPPPPPPPPMDPVQDRLQGIDQRVKQRGYGDSGGPRRPEG